MGTCGSSIDPTDQGETSHNNSNDTAEIQNAGDTRQAIKTTQRKANGVDANDRIHRQTPSASELKHSNEKQSTEQPSRHDMLQVYKGIHPDLTASLKTIANIMDFLDASLVNGFAEEDQLEKTLQKTKLLSLFFKDVPEKVLILTSFLVDLEGVLVIRDVISRLYTDFPEVVKQRDIEQGKETADEVEASGVIVEGHLSQPMIISTAQNVISYLTLLSQNLTDSHDALCTACREKGLVPILMEISKALADNLTDEDLEHQDEEDDMGILANLFDNTLSTLYNVARRTGPTHLANDFSSFVPTLLNWATTKGTYFGTVALLCLAYLIDEQNNHLIEAQKEMIQFLVDTLETALNFTDRNSFGFSSSELAEGLTQLASNDTNKRILGELGAIKILAKMVETARDDEEAESSLQALWVLAFDDQNKNLIKNEQYTLQRFHTLAKSRNIKVQKAAAGVLWEIEGKQERNLPLRSGGSTEQQQQQHVMISYQWDVQNVVKEVKNRLQAAGYCVWMDIDNMGGSTLEAMARAVEDACAVLVCVSQKYKDSPNCRSEAEYTYQLRKEIVPLMMERNYKPDGWLGIILGTKLWIDFRDRLQLNANIEKLIKTLERSGTRGTVKEQIAHPSVAPMETNARVDDISNWNKQDVENWLERSGMPKVRRKALKRLDGLALLHLIQLRTESPEYFYRCLEKDLGLTSVFDVFKFRDELDKIS